MTPPVNNGAREFDFLSVAVRPTPDLARLRASLVEGALDFAVVEELAADHGVRPLLAIALAAVQWQGVPATLRTSLDSFAHGHLVRTLAMSEALGRLVRLFGQNAIRFAVFKGAVLAADLYGDLSRREFTDIDVIVPPGSRAGAEALAATLGYVSRQGERAFREAFLGYQGQYALVGNDTAVDLHWDFSAVPLPFPLSAAEIWPKLVSTRVGNTDVPSLAPDDLALLLAGHGMKEAWKSLAWICDFAMLIDRLPHLDWTTLYGRAHRRGCGDAVLVGATLAERICGVAMPAGLKPIVGQRLRVERVVTKVVARLHDRHAIRQGQRDLDDLDLCDDAWGRFKALAGFALTPTPGDYRALPLPRPLWPLYYVARPVRLAGRLLFRR